MKARQKAIATLATGLTLAFGGTALAGSTFTATGTATKDAETTLEMDLDAKVKKGVVKSASITRLAMTNAQFSCSATGYEGRDDFYHVGLGLDPVEVGSNGKFTDVYETEARGYVINRHTLTGKVVTKGKTATITGTYRAEQSEGGLQFNNCDTGTVAFKLKAKI